MPNINTPCGGKGICGKCRVRIIEGYENPNETDKRFLSESEINNGWRIWCSHSFNDSVVLEQKENAPFSIVSEYMREENIMKAKNEGYSVNIDIGTTTICFELVDISNGKVLAVFSSLNSQTLFGADVISRLAKALLGGLSELNSVVKNDLKRGIEVLIKNVDKKKIKHIVIAGNTAMIYILRKMNCADIASYPFVNNASQIYRTKFNEFFNDFLDLKCDVVVLPCISSFVGADIVSGGIFCEIRELNNSILIDIGTNGEMLLNSNGRLYCTSAAAGPAFEGVNISCGVGSIEGAVCGAKYDDDFILETIGGKEPVGICGSALIDLAAIFLEQGFIDETGLMKDEYFENGIYITERLKINQKDIRQFQLAKGAIRAGIECILKKGSLKYEDIQNVFIGGGFGFHINIENAFKTGLLPKEFSGKIKVCGNTALGGIMKMSLDEDFERSRYYIENTDELNLAEDENFNSLFFKYMNFCIDLSYYSNPT